MRKCKITSIKPLGKQKTYNLTMSGNQHNYKIVDPSGNGIYTKNSHSCAYAFMAYQTAWLKIYYPLEFMCNLLSSEINNSDKGEKMDLYFKAAGKMGIKIYRTNLNKSGKEFIIDKMLDPKSGKLEEILRTPLTTLGGVGSKAVNNIVDHSPYSSLEDFIKRTDQRVVNSRVFNTLVACGAMDSALPESRDVLLAKYDEVKKKIAKDKKAEKKQAELIEKNKGKPTLFDDDDSFGISVNNVGGFK